jgi:hypothetical protein
MVTRCGNAWTMTYAACSGKRKRNALEGLSGRFLRRPVASSGLRDKPDYHVVKQPALEGF